MKKPIKILFKIFIIIVLVIVALTTKYKIEYRNKIIKESESIIEQLKKSLQEQEELNYEVTDKLQNIMSDYESINKNLENLRKDYEELEQKYLEEIKPVSFNPDNLWSESNATVYDMAVALNGTGLESVASTYVQAEKEWGVNAIFLASLTAEESGWGYSERAIYQNNLSGHAVYSASAEGTTFSTKEESIMKTAELICVEYLKPTGRYHIGIDIESVNELYCPNDGKQWSRNISSIAYELIDKINNR